MNAKRILSLPRRPLPRRPLAAAVCLALLGFAADAHAFSFTTGDLVVAVEGNGSNTGSYTLDQAAPLTLYQFGLSGTSAATFAGSLELPQTASGSNFAISGEYGSASEALLQLSGNGQYLTVMGYGVNANAFNANPSAYGSATGALGQSSSIQSSAYTAVPRVVALIGANGSVNTSTALYGVYNSNNPRSVYTADGKTFYVSGQGTSGDTTGGVFYTTLGSHSATAVTGLDTSSKTASQDTRFVTAYNGQLYVSADSKQGSGSNRDYIGTLGSAGTLPTSTVGGPVELSGFGNKGGTGKVTITAATSNGINSAGKEINLSPEQFVFADNGTVLYVADSGMPKNDSVTNDSTGSTLGDGGLQKWVLGSNGSWSLEYTLAAGLNLVANTAASGTTGLFGLTGKEVTQNGQTFEELFATSYGVGELDTTYLYGIADKISSTTGAGEQFTQLAVAPTDATFKGVSFAPTAPVPEPENVALLLAGLGIIVPAARRRRRG